MRYTILELDGSTWDAFADLVERNNGIYGGCWCIGYHPGVRAARRSVIAPSRRSVFAPIVPTPRS